MLVCRLARVTGAPSSSNSSSGSYIISDSSNSACEASNDRQIQAQRPAEGSGSPLQ